MELSQSRILQIVSSLLLLTVLTQVIYTALFVLASDVPRQWLWGVESLVFVLLCVFAGAAFKQADSYALGFSAIFACAILNVVQIGVGLTQFGPFREAAQSVEGVAPAAGAVVAFSFFVYNAAKVLLGVAALVFGQVMVQQGSKAIGWLAVITGVAAFVTNAVVMMFGRMEAVPSGAAGVLATLFLAFCLVKLRADD